jgi:hypothetical protein
MQRFDIPYNQSTLTIRPTSKSLFSVSIDNTFIGYIAKKGDIFKLQPSSKLSIEAYELIVSEIKNRL